MEEMLVHVLVRLVRIGDSLGDEAFERAVARTLLAIGQVALEEAEANEPDRSERERSASIIPFPGPAPRR